MIASQFRFEQDAPLVVAPIKDRKTLKAHSRIHVGEKLFSCTLCPKSFAKLDHLKKHQTMIGSGTKTGANSVLVAPLKLGKNVTVAAGSTITKNVPDNALVIARESQRVIENWADH